VQPYAAVKFLETEGTQRGFKSAYDEEEDQRRSGASRHYIDTSAQHTRAHDTRPHTSYHTRMPKEQHRHRVCVCSCWGPFVRSLSWRVPHFFPSSISNPTHNANILRISLFPPDTTSTRAEAEFVAAFDSLLRNSRDQVPPQDFFERLAYILMRRRDAITPENRRESMG
jgi:hypothetical protein